MENAKFRERRKLSLHVKCSLPERELWSAKAHSHGLSLSGYVREFLQDAPSSRRRPPPPINPALITQIARAGNNLNQIAKAVNWKGRPSDEIDLLAVLAELVVVERALQQICKDHSA
ncbi:plasmid mobilization protein [Tateyamaria sp.]|uniref:plasmid mobilization protein n=1 Tax=Tateyamaria sp. TaxID=1929288 RepID=UPI0039B90BE2